MRGRAGYEWITNNSSCGSRCGGIDQATEGGRYTSLVSFTNRLSTRKSNKWVRSCKKLYDKLIHICRMSLNVFAFA